MRLLRAFLFTTFRVLVYLLLGTLLFGVSLSGANYAAALVGLILAIISFARIGIIAAAIIMVIKRGDAVTGTVASVATLVGGVYYPVAILPPGSTVASQAIAHYLCFASHAPGVTRRRRLGRTCPGSFCSRHFYVVLLPISLLLFRYAVQRARFEGTLAHF
jgi:ABC-2 type transport system permease protein